MTIVDVHLTEAHERMLAHLVREGIGRDGVDVMRKALERLIEIEDLNRAK